MITIRVQRERLQILLDEVFPIMLAKGELASLSSYAHPCGTPCCIAGEACVLPRFNVMGLRLITKAGGSMPIYKEAHADRALNNFFGDRSFQRLFDLNPHAHSDLQEVKLRQMWLKEYLNEYHVTD